MHVKFPAQANIYLSIEGLSLDSSYYDASQATKIIRFQPNQPTERKNVSALWVGLPELKIIRDCTCY